MAWWLWVTKDSRCGIKKEEDYELGNKLKLVSNNLLKG